MKKQIMTFILTVVMALGICGAVSAAEAGNVVGYVNVQQVFQSYPVALAQKVFFIFGGLQVKVNNVRS